MTRLLDAKRRPVGYRTALQDQQGGVIGTNRTPADRCPVACGERCPWLRCPEPVDMIVTEFVFQTMFCTNNIVVAVV